MDFVARHYREGRFDVSAGWRRLGIAPVYSAWRRFRVAAAVAAAVILSATAVVVYRHYDMEESSRQTEAAQPVSPMAAVRVIDFEDAPLPEVVGSIESLYGVKVGNLPDSPEEYTLSLHYEGTPADLLGTINEILGTRMTVEEK